MITYKAGDQVVTIHLHPGGKRVRVTCSCADDGQLMPCSHQLDALMPGWEDDFEGPDSEVDAFIAGFSDRGEAAEEIEGHQRDLVRYTKDLAEAEVELAASMREPDAQQRSISVPHDREYLRECQAYIREEIAALKKDARQTVRLVLGCTASSRQPAKWEHAVDADTVKEVEDAYISELLAPSIALIEELRATRVETAEPVGCAATIILAVLIPQMIHGLLSAI